MSDETDENVTEELLASLTVLRSRMSTAYDEVAKLHDPDNKQWGGNRVPKWCRFLVGAVQTTDYYARAHVESQKLQNLCRDLEEAVFATAVEVTALQDASGVGRPLPSWFQSLQQAAGALVEGVSAAHPKRVDASSPHL